MRVLTPDSSLPSDPVLIEAARILDSGGVVAIPTETVYGLACRSAFPDAIARIFEIKGRPLEKRLPFLIPDAARLGDFTNSPSPRALRLAARWWPGPMTLVVGHDPNSIAVRVPDSPITRTILGLCAGPVHGTSANRSGAPAATDASGVVMAFEGGAAPDLIVDGGPCRVAKESTLVRVTPSGEAQILRQGALSHDDLVASATARILLVCSGNTCRSPMAVIIMRALLADALRISTAELPAWGLSVESAGTAASDGAPASSGAMGVARRRGASLTQHASRYVGSVKLESFERVFGFTPEHVSSLRSRFGVARAETLDPRGRGIADPFGGSDSEYDDAADSIDEAVSLRIPELIKLAFRPTS